MQRKFIDFFLMAFKEKNNARIKKNKDITPSKLVLERKVRRFIFKEYRKNSFDINVSFKIY